MSKSAVHKQSAWAGSSGLGPSTIAASALILHLTAVAIKESSMPRQQEETKAKWKLHVRAQFKNGYHYKTASLWGGLEEQ